MVRVVRVALIGSRDIEKPENVSKYQSDILLCRKVAYNLAKRGVVFTSGLCALGMDAIAQRTYSMAVDRGDATEDQFEVYVKDEAEIKKSILPCKHLARVRNPLLIQETEDIAASVHPAWDKCNAWARGMHSRNCHQILGYDLKSPVDAVVCWTPNGKIQGGTATAIRIALRHGIPVFNLGDLDKGNVVQQIKDFLATKGIV